MDEEKSTAEQQQQTAQQPPSEGTSEDSKDNNNKEKSKVHILLLPTGGVPIIKKKNFKVDASYTIGQIIQFIKNFIKLEANESIFVYVNQLFAPSIDQTVKNLFECFGCDGKLILYYAKSQAWG